MTGGAAVQSAIVTGPGLPLAGAIFNRLTDFYWFGLSGGMSNYYFMTDDATIGAIPDNAEYTFVLKDASNGSGNILATYKQIVPKRPLMSTELSSFLFPVITAPTVANLSPFAGGDLPVIWTLPTGYYSRYLAVDLFYTGDAYNNMHFEVLLNGAESLTPKEGGLSDRRREPGGYRQISGRSTA